MFNFLIMRLQKEAWRQKKVPSKDDENKKNWVGVDRRVRFYGWYGEKESSMQLVFAQE
jgi:hypothetical protein